jgi:O-antigen ligase
MAKKLVAAILGSAAIFGLAYLKLGMELFNTSDRWKIWTFMMERWNTPNNAPFGTGWGTYHVFSINLQEYGKIPTNTHWNTLHNNWLQFLFEMGWTGLVLSLLVYVAALKAALKKRDKGIVIALVLYGLYMAMDPALNFAYPAAFGAWLFLAALRRESLHCNGRTA